MARHRLVIGEGGQREARPFGGVLQVDVEGARPAAVGGGALIIAVGGAILDEGRHAAYLHRRLGQGDEQFLQPRHGVPDLLVEQPQHRGAAFVGVRVNLVGPLAQRHQPLAHRALGQPLRLQHRVELGGDVGDLGEAELMHLLGGHVGGGGGFHPGVVILGPIGQFPNAGIAGRLRAQRLHSGDIAIIGWIDLSLDDAGGPRRPVARQIGSLCLACQAGDEDRFGRRAAADGIKLAKRQIKREIGRDHALAGVFLGPGQIVIEGLRIGRQARTIGLGIALAGHAVLAVEEIRQPLIGAVLLADDIGLEIAAGAAEAEACLVGDAAGEIIFHHVAVELAIV